MLIFLRPKNVPAITGSKDLQNVNITLRILFRCDQVTMSLMNIYPEKKLSTFFLDLSLMPFLRFTPPLVRTTTIG